MSNSVPPSPRYDHVSRRAYEIWEQKGRPDGNEQEHWYLAERELMQTGTASIAEEIANDPKPVGKTKSRVKRSA